MRFRHGGTLPAKRAGSRERDRSGVLEHVESARSLSNH